MDLQYELGEWYPFLKEEFTRGYMEKIGRMLAHHKDKLEPKLEDVFRAFRLTPPSKTKVVIIGQDPYPEDADGLAFSCRTHVPYSLRIIFTELEYEGLGTRVRPMLDDWAEQGVLLLNNSLSNIRKHIGAHKDIGWDMFIREVLIHLLNYPHIVYMLWGSDARATYGMVPNGKYKPGKILTSDHPAAMRHGTGRKPFIGNGHFIEANLYLLSKGRGSIDWVNEQTQEALNTIANIIESV